MVGYVLVVLLSSFVYSHCFKNNIVVGKFFYISPFGGGVITSYVIRDNPLLDRAYCLVYKCITFPKKILELLHAYHIM